MKTKIRLQNGETLAIEGIAINDKPKTYLEHKIGLIYGKGDLYAQTIGMVNAWTVCHTPEDDDSDGVINAAVLIVLKGLSEKIGGFVVRAIETDELFIYVPEKSDNYIVRIAKGFYEMLAKNEWDFSPYVESVKTLGKKITVDDLTQQLKETIESENYELAAKLRDKIVKKKH